MLQKTMHLTDKKLEKRITELEKFRYIDHRPIPEYRFWVDKEAVVGAMPPETAQWGSITLGERWSGWGSYRLAEGGSRRTGGVER